MSSTPSLPHSTWRFFPDSRINRLKFNLTSSFKFYSMNENDVIFEVHRRSWRLERRSKFPCPNCCTLQGSTNFQQFEHTHHLINKSLQHTQHQTDHSLMDNYNVHWVFFFFFFHGIYIQPESRFETPILSQLAMASMINP